MRFTNGTLEVLQEILLIPLQSFLPFLLLIQIKTSVAMTTATKIQGSSCLQALSCQLHRPTFSRSARCLSQKRCCTSGKRSKRTVAVRSLSGDKLDNAAAHSSLQSHSIPSVKQDISKPFPVKSALVLAAIFCASLYFADFGWTSSTTSSGFSFSGAVKGAHCASVTFPLA